MRPHSYRIRLGGEEKAKRKIGRLWFLPVLLIGVVAGYALHATNQRPIERVASAPKAVPPDYSPFVAQRSYGPFVSEVRKRDPEGTMYAYTGPPPPSEEQLAEWKHKAIQGDITARIRFTSRVDLAAIRPPVCDQLADERIQYARQHPDFSEDTRAALIQLGALRQSKKARTALLSLTSDIKPVTNARWGFWWFALMGLQLQLKKDDELIGSLANRRAATHAEITLFEQLLRSPDRTQRMITANAIGVVGMIEMAPQLKAAYHAEHDHDVKERMAQAIGFLQPVRSAHADSE